MFPVISLRGNWDNYITEGRLRDRLWHSSSIYGFRPFDCETFK